MATPFATRLIILTPSTLYRAAWSALMSKQPNIVLSGGQVEQQWQTHRHHLARRDPGRRVLVVVNVRHCHHIRPALRNYTEIEVVPYTEL